MYLGLPCTDTNGDNCGVLIRIEPRVGVDLLELERVDVAVGE